MRGSDGGKAERFIPLATVELREVEKLCHPLQHPFMTSFFTHFKLRPCNCIQQKSKLLREADRKSRSGD